MLGLWETLWDFFASLAAGNNTFLAVVVFLVVVPALPSAAFAWLIAGASNDASTPLTLFVRALTSVILCVIFLAVAIKVLKVLLFLL